MPAMVIGGRLPIIVGSDVVGTSGPVRDAPEAAGAADVGFQARRPLFRLRPSLSLPIILLIELL